MMMCSVFYRTVQILRYDITVLVEQKNKSDTLTDTLPGSSVQYNNSRRKDTTDTIPMNSYFYVQFGLIFFFKEHG